MRIIAFLLLSLASTVCSTPFYLSVSPSVLLVNSVETA